MREDCKNYESRTYNSGEVVRMCRIDLAPDAPWKCPDECKGFVRRTIDAGWTVGTLASKPTPAPPPAEVDDQAAAILDAAEDIINAIGPEVLESVKKQRAKGQPGPRGVAGRLRRRKKKK
jgi:hypothetical protein